MLLPLSPATLAKQATDTLRRYILSQDLREGAELPSERDLSESLSVSRNIVREALTTLMAEGMIIKKPGRGIFVSVFDRHMAMARVSTNIAAIGYSLSELGEARYAIELGAASLMSKHITDDELMLLEEINTRLAEKIQHHFGGVREDIEFHEVLLRSTHNLVIVDFLPVLIEHFRLMVLTNPASVSHNAPRVIAEHAAIIAALHQHDAALVREALIAHFPDLRLWR
jgi:GntR family transcriptional repressor for pyruvate dehydrogenase complex